LQYCNSSTFTKLVGGTIAELQVLAVFEEFFKRVLVILVICESFICDETLWDHVLFMFNIWTMQLNVVKNPEDGQVPDRNMSG
jgi:hypothetical protein